VLVVGAVAATYGVQQKRVGDQRNRVVAEQERLEDIALVLTASDVRVRHAQSGSGTLAVAVSAQKDAAVATMDGMPRPESGRCYQFWRMVDGTPVSAGVLAGGQTAGPQLIGGLGRADAIAVTREPCGGSEKPTMAPIAAVTVA
jgi:hypothetical protein